MIDIVINNCAYSCPISWDEVELRQAIELQAVAQNAPNQVKEYFASQFEPSAHEPSICTVNSTQLLDLLIDVASILCCIDKTELRMTDPQQIESFANQYLAPFIVSVIFDPVYTPRHIVEFEWNGEVLRLPTTTEDSEGVNIQCEEISAEQLCQATDLHIAGSLRYAATIVALLCKPEGEIFCMKRALERAKTMNRLPMSIVFEVFFCFRKLMNI